MNIYDGAFPSNKLYATDRSVHLSHTLNHVVQQVRFLVLMTLYNGQSHNMLMTRIVQQVKKKVQA